MLISFFPLHTLRATRASKKCFRRRWPMSLPRSPNCYPYDPHAFASRAYTADSLAFEIPRTRDQFFPVYHRFEHQKINIVTPRCHLFFLIRHISRALTGEALRYQQATITSLVVIVTQWILPATCYYCIRRNRKGCFFNKCKSTLKAL